MSNDNNSFDSNSGGGNSDTTSRSSVNSQNLSHLPSPPPLLSNNINNQQRIQQNSQKMPLSRSLTQPQGTIEYVVTSNDTITSVAARFHTTPSELARINRRSGYFIFPGQVLYVPKSNHLSSLSADNVADGCLRSQNTDVVANVGVPPNTPNDPKSQSPSRYHVIISNINNELPGDNISSAVPGHAERVPFNDNPNNGSVDNVFVNPPSEQQAVSPLSIHHPLIHTISEPVVPKMMAVPNKTEFDTAKNIETIMTMMAPHPQPKQHQVTTIDPADRECLERFLKINVRYITDGQGVVNGVLLVTPNALMFDSNVSDPLVMEHGSEMYNVTVPIELVLKTALYSDIAHMRVKHAPEAVPSVPKPSVYYASDEDSGGIVEENLKNVYAKKKSAFDTIGKVSEEKSESEETSKQTIEPKPEKLIQQEKLAKVDGENFKDAVEHLQPMPTQDSITTTIISPTTASCDDIYNNSNNSKNFSNLDYNEDEQLQQQSKIDPKQSPKNQESSTKTVRQQPLTTEQLSSTIQNKQKSTDLQIGEESTRFYDDDDDDDDDDDNDNDDENSQKRSLNKIEIENSLDLNDPSTATHNLTSMEVNSSLDLMMTSMDEQDINSISGSLSTSPSSATDYQQKLQKKPLPCHIAKISLAERHSAPSQPSSNDNHQDHHDSNRSLDIEHKSLQSAISAEETCSDPVIMRTHSNRLSAAGENRRGQMLKRLSNPVDAIGNFTKSGISSGINATKSGFNATKTGISKGLNATQSGISTGYHVTKSGLTTGLSVTKTGFNKVLATPKNIMDFSSGLVRDAKGALAPTGSKSDINLQEHLNSLDENTVDQQKSKSATLGYYNMVDTKIDAFENFDKLIPRPARVNKDSPLYLCIRMGKYKKNDAKRNQRFSPTYSFGKNKYEREYWFSVPKDKAKNLYHFFKKWAPEVYGDVDDISGCEQRGLEPFNTDDEFEMDDEQDSGSSGKNADGESHRRSYLRISSQDKGSLSHGDDTVNNSKASNDDPLKSMDATSSRQRFWRRSPLHFLKLVEDHFSTDGLSTDWNVSNSSEEHSFAERYNLELNTEPILPELIGPSELLNVDIIQNLSKHLPARAEGYAWTLIYSTSQHGFSLNTLYRDMKHFDSPVLLIIEDTNGAIFGALLSHSLRMSDHFYGTGETFLFTFHPTFECFPWTGENIFFIKGNIDSISVGAGEGNFGLWLDGDLYHGSSHPCKTFGNPTLSSEEDFVVKSIECWGFV